MHPYIVYALAIRDGKIHSWMNFCLAVNIDIARANAKRFIEETFPTSDGHSSQKWGAQPVNEELLDVYLMAKT